MSLRFWDCLDHQTFTDTACEVPYQQIKGDFFPGFDVWVRRDDLIDPIISGNKAYKLFFNLIEAKDRGAKILITCGGAWSNHIHAVAAAAAAAAAAARFGFQTIGIVRGERLAILNASLQDAQRFGMKLKFVTRTQYRKRNQSDFLHEMGLDSGAAYFIPEGGSNLLGIKGIQLLGKVIEETVPATFDQMWVACGAGATFAGFSAGIRNISVIGVEILRAGDSIFKEVDRWIKRLNLTAPEHLEKGRSGTLLSSDRLSDLRLRLLNQYHCGGYGQYPKVLADFQREFEGQVDIPLNPIYTSKLFHAIKNSNDRGGGQRGARLLVIHTGGLQGRRGD
ncbi:1-aminocyclopropane-1-carboxylate deaminase/D-cysteine desulfhydrase [Microbulbifer spongiae]|uniref:Pyridoxal-phosphate dependent enzyme n=1 Tax=Microbulbifer spongiae TaxID=2944933 RepID=A0ABY9EJJ2_9GAMM|nr:pyridoxal-phosphate dependent enzyme [Microbulbifer sp. MI-G]WKD51441.1 pyridoxal-phosphate dependent enzyme [Microbulbifer sp. MI-G]